MLTTVGCRLVVVCLGFVLVMIFGYGYLDRHMSQVHTQALAIGLSDKVVVIDAGHDGRDPGASGGNVQEKDINLDISLRLADLVKLAGGRAVLTRKDDSDLSRLYPGDTTLKRREINYRLKVIADSNPDIVVSIHANSSRSSLWYGAQAFFDRTSEPESKQLAQFIQAELRRHTTTDRQAASIDQYLLKHCSVPAVTVEVGFLSNPREATLLAQDEYRQKVAWAIFSGLTQFFADRQIISGWLQNCASGDDKQENIFGQ